MGLVSGLVRHKLTYDVSEGTKEPALPDAGDADIKTITDGLGVSAGEGQGGCGDLGEFGDGGAQGGVGGAGGQAGGVTGGQLLET